MRNSTQSGRLARKVYLFLLPSLAGTAVFVLLPYVDVIRRSFFEAAGGRFVAMQNYLTVMGNRAFRLASFNTLRFLVICVPLLVVVSLFCSMMIAGLKEGGTVFKTSLLIPLAIPVASIVLLWKLFFHPQGLVNQITALFGMPGMNWIDGDTAFGVLVFTYVWKNLGYDVVLWVAGLAAIPDELYEAARVDGAGILARFLYVTLPGLSKTAVLVVSLSVFNSFKVFREAYLIAGEYPDESIYMLQHLFNHWFVTLDIQKMSAASVLLLLAVLLPGIFSTFPVFIMTQFFSSIPLSLLEAARLDGAGEGAVFIRIGIPMGFPGIMSAGILGFLESWNAIEAPMAFLKDRTLWPLSLYLPDITADKVSVAWVASVAAMAPPLFLFLAGQSFLEQGIMVSGIKE